MCFANRKLCKKCGNETLKYFSKCDQFPEVAAETATHAIRGRHRRIGACIDCVRRERQRVEEESRNNAVHQVQAKAILEWLRLERPLPLIDEEIAVKYRALYMNHERLHPYCVGFTDMHEELIAERRRAMSRRTKRVVAEWSKAKKELSKAAIKAVARILEEENIMDEAFWRQAEIDSGVRTMTESDEKFSLHDIGNPLELDNAIDLIIESQQPAGLEFKNWVSDIDDSFMTEDLLREEIHRYIDDMTRDGFDEMINQFSYEVFRLNVLDEDIFDFDPGARALSGDTPAGATPDMPGRVTFREWVVQYDDAMRTITPWFERWYRIIDGYRAYLAQISTELYTLFDVTRNSIAARMFQVLTDRSLTLTTRRLPQPPPSGVFVDHESEDHESEDEGSGDEKSDDGESDDGESDGRWL